MTDNSNSQLVVRAKFNFQQTNEDELSFTKGDVIHVTRVEEGGWWEGTHNGRTGWFPSNYVREIKPSGKWLSQDSWPTPFLLDEEEPKDTDVLSILRVYSSDQLREMACSWVMFSFYFSSARGSRIKDFIVTNKLCILP
jgi:hypothetical protein